MDSNLKGRVIPSLLALAVFALFSAAGGFSQQLPDIDARNGSGDSGSLHEFLHDSGSTLVALSMAEDQDTGEAQLQTLLQTHQTLDRRTNLSRYRIIHVNVIAGAPWFVRGVIRRGLAGEYEDPVEDEQVIVLFIDDLAEFSSTVDIPVTQRPSWLSVSPDGIVEWWERDRGQTTAATLLERLDS